MKGRKEGRKGAYRAASARISLVGGRIYIFGWRRSADREKSLRDGPFAGRSYVLYTRCDGKYEQVRAQN